MSEPVTRHARRLVGRIVVVLMALGVVATALAPAVGAAGGLTVTTPFPAVVAEPGSNTSFKLTFDVATARRVDLKANGVPSGWTARFRGGGSTIDGAFIDPRATTPPDISLDVEVPDGATPGSSTITVQATGGGGSDTLALTIRIADAAQGDVSLTSDFPELKGPSTTTFTYNVSIHNDTSADETFTMDATGPDGWTVAVKPAGEANATSTKVTAGSTGAITVTATPPAQVDAASYPITVTVNGGGKTASLDLAATVTGSYTLTVSTPNQVLSTSANAGSQTDLQLTLTNTGTAPITNIEPSASTPTGWKVTFDPATVASVPPTASGTQPTTVTAHITPSSDAIAGDYEVTITAKGTEASDDATIRVTVQTPQFWWIIGIVLIVAVFAGLYWVFRTYGRR